MHVMTLENVSKSYSDKTLFNDINFSINDTDKIGLIGINGTGKTTLLRIIAGAEYADTGNIINMKNIRIGYLSQTPEFDSNATVIEQVFKGDSQVLRLVRDYESITSELEKSPSDQTLIDQQLELMTKMNAQNAWELESQVKNGSYQTRHSRFQVKDRHT